MRRFSLPVTVASDSVAVAFGPVCVAFEGPQACLELLRCRYHDRLADPVAATARVRWIETGGIPNELGSPLAVVREPTQWRPTSGDSAGAEAVDELIGKSFRIELATPQADAPETSVRVYGPAALYPIDHLLEILLPAAWCHGPLLHAAALVREAPPPSAWIASGPSGIGKSTLARLCGDHAIADEVVAIDLRPEVPIVHSLPYSASRPAQAPLVGIHLLRQAPHHRTRRLAASQALRRLAREVLWPPPNPASHRRLFDQLSDLVTRVPSWELSFAPTPDIWSFLTRSTKVAA